MRLFGLFCAYGSECSELSLPSWPTWRDILCAQLSLRLCVGLIWTCCLTSSDRTFILWWRWYVISSIEILGCRQSTHLSSLPAANHSSIQYPFRDTPSICPKIKKNIYSMRWAELSGKPFFIFQLIHSNKKKTSTVEFLVTGRLIIAFFPSFFARVWCVLCVHIMFFLDAMMMSCDDDGRAKLNLLLIPTNFRLRFLAFWFCSSEKLKSVN